MVWVHYIPVNVCSIETTNVLSFWTSTKDMLSLNFSNETYRFERKKAVFVDAYMSEEEHGCNDMITLQWRHNERDCVSNHQPYDCLLMHLFRRRSKKKMKAPSHWSLWGEFTGDRWIPRTNGQKRGKCFLLTTSSCIFQTRELMLFHI